MFFVGFLMTYMDDILIDTVHKNPTQDPKYRQVELNLAKTN